LHDKNEDLVMSMEDVVELRVRMDGDVTLMLTET
jgi:hypothetical protein